MVKILINLRGNKVLKNPPKSHQKNQNYFKRDLLSDFLYIALNFHQIYNRIPHQNFAPKSSENQKEKVPGFCQHFQLKWIAATHTTRWKQEPVHEYSLAIVVGIVG
jgi:hypothetical protein